MWIFNGKYREFESLVESLTLLNAEEIVEMRKVLDHLEAEAASYSCAALMYTDEVN